MIFVIDDEALVRHAIATALERAGYVVESFSEAASAAGAIDILRPFMIILDVALAESDGVEALQLLADRRFGGAIQILSGRPASLLIEIQHVGENRNLRMLPPVTKPCRMLALREIADREAAQQRTAAEAPIRAPHLTGAHSSAPQVDVSLGDALDRRWVEVWYQPKIDLRSDMLIGAECLARIRLPSGDTVLPGSFLPGASHLTMTRLTEFVLRQSVGDWLAFSEAGNPLTLSINVPSKLLASMPFPALLRDCIPRVADWPGLLFEITEEDAIRDVTAAREAATQLKIYGVELSIDDFGLGYSSLSRLGQIPFKEIKLDRSLVHDCSLDKTRAGLCKAVVELGKTFEASVVAEGIENRSDLAVLQGLGCQIGQGYLFGRPMPKAEMVARIGMPEEHFR